MGSVLSQLQSWTIDTLGSLYLGRSVLIGIIDIELWLTAKILISQFFDLKHL